MHRHIKPAIILWNFFSSLERKGSRPIFLPFWLCWRDIWFLSFICLAMLGRGFLLPQKGCDICSLPRAWLQSFIVSWAISCQDRLLAKLDEKNVEKKPNPKQDNVLNLFFIVKDSMYWLRKGQQRIIDQQSVQRAEVEEPFGTVGMRSNKFLLIIVLAFSFIGDFFPIQMATRYFLEIVSPN